MIREACEAFSRRRVRSAMRAAFMQRRLSYVVEPPSLASSALEAIGNTPLVDLARLCEAEGVAGRILAKVEYFNPGCSKKDRIARQMLEEATAAGELSPGQPVIELTSGNTGTGLALCCAVLGHPFIAVMSAGNSPERAHQMRALGAEVVLVPQATTGKVGAVSGSDLALVEIETQRLAVARGAYRADQFSLPANARAHYLYTGPEVWRQSRGSVDGFVDFVGSGGTFGGVARFLKECRSDIRCYLVEPEASAVLSSRHGVKIEEAAHRIQGGGYSKSLEELSAAIEPSVINGVLTVDDDTAVRTARSIALHEGLFCGFSSGANVAAALKVLGTPWGKGRTIATMLCDSGLKYLSTDLWEDSATNEPANKDTRVVGSTFAPSVPTFPSVAKIPTTQPQGFATIGSFMSLGIEELILPENSSHRRALAEQAKAELQYHSHDLDGLAPIGDCSFKLNTHAMAQRSFMLDRSWTFLNHGAFGAGLRCGFNAATCWRGVLEAQPLRFFDRMLLPLIADAIADHAAPFLGVSDPTRLALVPNATAALNGAIQTYCTGLDGTKDAIMCLDISYGSVKAMLRHAAAGSGAKYCEANILGKSSTTCAVFGFPEDEDEIMRRVERAIDECEAGGRRVRLLVFDHVASNTSMRLPIMQLSRLARSRGAISICDGAHGPVQEVDCGAPTFGDRTEGSPCVYVGNLHKWACAPRGIGFIWWRRGDESLCPVPRPAIVSHGYNSGFQSSWCWDGTRDHAATLALPFVIEWFARLESSPGGAHALESTRLACRRYAAQLVEEWGTDAPLERTRLNAGMMSLVEVPRSAWTGRNEPVRAPTSADAKALQDRLHYEHRVECPVKRFDGAPSLFVRVSTHLYTAKADIDALAAAISTISSTPSK